MTDHEFWASIAESALSLSLLCVPVMLIFIVYVIGDEIARAVRKSQKTRKP